MIISNIFTCKISYLKIELCILSLQESYFLSIPRSVALLTSYDGFTLPTQIDYLCEEEQGSAFNSYSQYIRPLG